MFENDNDSLEHIKLFLENVNYVKFHTVNLRPNVFDKTNIQNGKINFKSINGASTASIDLNTLKMNGDKIQYSFETAKITKGKDPEIFNGTGSLEAHLSTDKVIAAHCNNGTNEFEMKFVGKYSAKDLAARQSMESINNLAGNIKL